MIVMRGRSRWAIMLWAVLNLALPGAVSVIDALASQNEGTRQAHIESESGAGCARVHADNCALCRYLAGSDGQARESAPLLVAAAEGWQPESREHGCVVAVSTVRRARAPPAP